MQYRFPVGLGPSSKTCPRCPPHFLHRTSVRLIKWLVSDFFSTASSETGFQKLGHPVPESNFVSEENSFAPHPAQAYLPLSFVFQYFPVNAVSVPFSRRIWYCSEVSFFFQSGSFLPILSSNTGGINTLWEYPI